MNHFEFFNIPESLTIDEDDLKQKFYANSKRFHPDFFTLDDVEKQMEALELSTKNNTAFKTLMNFDKRLHYFLELKGVLNEEGKNAMPQEFLMEMMDVNEAVMELQFDFNEEAYQSIIGDLSKYEQEQKGEVEAILSKKDDEFSDEDYNSLLSFYLKSKYLKRLEENVKKLK